MEKPRTSLMKWEESLPVISVGNQSSYRMETESKHVAPTVLFNACRSMSMPDSMTGAKESQLE